MTDATGPRATPRGTTGPSGGGKRTPNLVALRSSPPKPRPAETRAAPPAPSPPASTPGHAEGEADPKSIWKRIVEHASQRTADDALIKELKFEEGEADRLRLRLVDARTPTAGFIQSNPDRIEKIVQQAIGRRITVELIAAPTLEREPEPSATDEAIVDNPLVRKAVGLFDATIHSVRKLPGRTEEDPASTPPDSSME